MNYNQSLASNQNYSSPLKILSITSLSILYACLLTYLPNDLFRDRSNYVIYASSSKEILDSYPGYTFLFNEPLFLYYNMGLENIFPAEQVPKFGVFFISFTLMYFILKNYNNALSVIIACLLLFFVPFTFHLQLVILRQGVATAILIWLVHFFWGRKIFYLLCFLLSFFHSSFIIIFFVLYSDNLLNTKIKSNKLRLIFIAILLLLSSAVLLRIGSTLGVRQVENGGLSNNDNGLGGFILFSFLLTFLYFRGLNNVYKDKYGRISLLGLIAYLSFYYTIPVSGRLISSFLPFTYIYLASSSNIKIISSFIVFLVVNMIIFFSSISNGSLTPAGVNYLNTLILGN